MFSLGAQVDDLLRSPDAADAGPDEARVAEANGVADKAGDKEALVHAEEHELADPALAIEQREVRSVFVVRGDGVEENVELAGVGGHVFGVGARNDAIGPTLFRDRLLRVGARVDGHNAAHRLGDLDAHHPQHAEPDDADDAIAGFHLLLHQRVVRMTPAH